MNYNKLYFLIFLFSLIAIEATSQTEKNVNVDQTIFLGYPAYLFDAPDFGVYLGYNIEMIRKPRFSWEGQASLSYSRFDSDDGIFAHDGGQTISTGLNFGPRFYLMKPEKPSLLYFNLLPGIALIQDEEYSGNGSSRTLIKDTIVLIDVNVGAYFQYKEKLVLGFAFENLRDYVLKIGYRF